MGLAERKFRTKRSRDPNNTAWSRSTSRFGHRVLVSQGWAPGQGLGASSAGGDASTDAPTRKLQLLLSATPRDGNMGLGAVRSGRAGDETFGLEVLSGVLGRLNGRSDEVLQKESEARRDARLSSWQVRKWGGKGFVSGGFLVTKTIEDDSPAQSTETEEKEAETMEQISSNSTDMEDGSRFKLANDGSLSEGVSERKRLKLEKRARKEARRLKREKRRQNSEKSSAALTPEDEASEAPTPVLSRLANSEVNSPSGSATPVSDSIRQQVQLRRRPGTRHAVRPDQKALNEIFMIKSK